MIDATDAGLLLETVQLLDSSLARAKVPETNPDRIKYLTLIDKLKDTINAPQIDAFTVEETKQLRILLTALLARLGCTITIDITDFIAGANADPNAYKMEVDPTPDGTKVQLKWTGQITQQFTPAELSDIQWHSQNNTRLQQNATTVFRGSNNRNP